jgi:hypothetical protein
MTENDLAAALKDLTKSVTDQRYEIGRDMATLTANVDMLQTSHEDNAKKLDEVLRLELSCLARAGFEEARDRITQLEADGKIRIESELRMARDEVTGQQDVERSTGVVGRMAASRRWNDSRGTLLRTLAVKALPYILFGCVALGAYLVSGGDEEATARALRAVSDAVARVDSKIEKVEAKVDDVSDDTGLAAAAVE